MAAPGSNKSSSQERCRWHRAISDVYNVPYWWNEDTNESIWVRPDGYVSDEDDADETRPGNRHARRSMMAARASLAGATTPSASAAAASAPSFALLPGGAALGVVKPSQQPAQGTATSDAMTATPAAEVLHSSRDEVAPAGRTSALAKRGVFGGAQRKGLGAAIVKKAKEVQLQSADPKLDMASLVSAATGKALPSSSVVNPLAAMKSAAERWRGKADDRNNGKHLELSNKGALGVPVRDLLQALYQSKRDKVLYEGILFLIWAAIFLVLVYFCTDIQTSFNTAATVRNRFIDQPQNDVNYLKTFNDVGDQGELWDWMKGPLYDGLYVTENYNAQPLADAERGYVDNYLRLVGGVRLRQLRVRNESCADMRQANECAFVATDGNDSARVCLPRFDTKDGTCFAEFSVAKEATAPFGPESDPARYKYETGMSALEGIYGWGPKYGTGGYTVYLPAGNSTEAWRLLNQMFEDGWTDRSTRAVAIDFNLHSTATGMVTCVRIVFEYFNVGFAMTDHKVYTFPLSLGRVSMQTVLLILDILYVVFLIYYSQKIVKGVYWSRPKTAYFRRIENLFEILLVGVNIALIRSWALFITAPDRSTFSASAARYQDLFSVALTYSDLISLAGFVGLLACLKFFRYMALQKRMNTLWLTLGKAFPELVAFTVSFFLLVAGYAFLGQMLFGALLADFHSIESSVSTLLRMALGDFNYDSLSSARPALVGIFFGSYVTLVFLVSLNLIIAILSKYYEEVHAELRAADKWKLSVLTLDAYLMKYITLYFRTKCQCARRGAEYCSAWKRHQAEKCQSRCNPTRCCGRNRSALSSATSMSRRLTRASPRDDGMDGNPNATEMDAGTGVSITNPMSRTRSRAGGGLAGQGQTPGNDGSTRRIAVARKSVMKVAALLDVNEDEARQAAWKEAQRARQLVMDSKQLESWKHEREFMAALRRVYHMGKRKLGFDLFEYCEHLSDQPGWDNCYIGLHELCVLTNPKPCQPGSHSTCPARLLINCYNNVKIVTMTGGLTGAYRHVPTTSFVNVRNYKKFDVVKINTNGFNQRRQLIVDTDNCCLVNLDTRGRVKKKLPLVQLIQLERLVDDESRLNLVFSSNGVHLQTLAAKDGELDDLLETSYMLSFQDERKRTAFVDEVLQAIDNLPHILSGTLATAEADVDLAAAASTSSDLSSPKPGAAGVGAAGPQSPGSSDGKREGFMSPASHLQHNLHAPHSARDLLSRAAQARTRRSSLTTKVLDAARDEYTKRQAMSTTTSMAHLVALMEKQQLQLLQGRSAGGATGPARRAEMDGATSGVDSASLSLIVAELRTQREMLQSIAAKLP